MTETQQRGRLLGTVSSIAAAWVLLSNFENPNTTVLGICAIALVIALVLMRRSPNATGQTLPPGSTSGALVTPPIVERSPNGAPIDAGVPEVASVGAAAIGLGIGFFTVLGSWRWGLVLGWGLLALLVLTVAALPFCRPPTCSLRPIDAAIPSTAALFVVLMCGSAFLGAIIRRRRDA